jgi:hypothetical protein
MVCIEDLQMEQHLDDFYRDGARFKNMKLLIDFNQVNLKVETPSFDPGKPKFKKKQTINIHIKPKGNDKSLF